MSRFENFTDEEVYILKRQAIEASYEITCNENNYSKANQITHRNLLNELIDENINRGM